MADTSHGRRVAISEGDLGLNPHYLGEGGPYRIWQGPPLLEVTRVSLTQAARVSHRVWGCALTKFSEAQDALA